VRTSRGLTQAQLAETVGIDQPNLSAYENDRRTPTLDVANRILVACGYQLVADGGRTQVRAPLPKVGWFPLEDLPPRLPDDPPDEEPTIAAAAPWEERRALIHGLMEAQHAERTALDRAFDLHRRCTEHGIPHAFGGTLARNLYADPQMTNEVELVIFDEEGTGAAGLDLSSTGRPRALTFISGEIGVAMADRTVHRDLGHDGQELPFLGADDVATLHLDRSQPADLVALGEMVRCGTPLDLDLIEDTLTAWRGPRALRSIVYLRALITPRDP
jgi:transcriptional regulator with XRE-family HTH domain